MTAARARDGARPSGRAERVFRALLAAYPGEFRDEYGREMALVFADRLHAASTTFERLHIVIDAAWGVVTQAPREHAAMVIQDLRYAVRGLRKQPTFTATVVVTLALGIGAITAVFQLIDAVRLRSLPVSAPEQLAEVRIVGGNRGMGITANDYGQLTRPMWEAIAANQQAFSGIFAFAATDGGVGDLPEVKRVPALHVSGAFFDTLGVVPVHGRLLGAGDVGSCPVTRAVVSHRYWQQGMGGAVWHAGQRLRVDGQSLEVVGVVPPGFTGLAVGDRFDVAVPLCQPSGGLRREVFDVTVMGRLRAGWSVERASAHLYALSEGIFEATAPTGYEASGVQQFKAFRLGAFPAASGVSRLRDTYDRSLWLLLGMSGLVLLMASANLANLMLARASTRDREVSIRLALGGSRGAIARQFVAECTLLAGAGAIGGAFLAQGLSRAIVSALGTEVGGPTLALTVDWTVLAFAAAAAAAACLIFGVAPILRASRIRAGGVLHSKTRGTSRDRSTARTQRAMVAVQVAASLILLAGAVLFVRSFHALLTFDPGMRREGITVAALGFHARQLPPERLNDEQRALVAAIKSVPGVIDAATTTTIPLLGSMWHHGVIVDGTRNDVAFTWVGPGYFDTMGIRLLQGRRLSLDDTRTSTRVAVVNQTFARQFTGGASPIGRTLRTQAEPGYPVTLYEIVGLIADTKYNSLRSETEAMVYAPDSQYPAIGPWAAVMIHSDGAPADVMRAVKARLRRDDPMLVAEQFDFESRVRDGLVRERLLATLAGFFGGLAALIAIVGIYGMVSYGVAQRRREIGVRVALGASRPRVVGMVMGEIAALFGVGVGVGGVLAVFGARATESLLFGLKPEDPSTLGAAAGILAVGAALASYIPARRAATVSPVVALRQD